MRHQDQDTSVDSPTRQNSPSYIAHSEPVAQPTYSLIAMGDIGLSGAVYRYGKQHGFDKIFQQIKPVLMRVDLVFGNLETPFLTNPKETQLFAAHPVASEAFADCNFKVLNLANNHIADHGLEGLNTSLTLLNHKDILPLGVETSDAEKDALLCIELDDVCVGWLGCSVPGELTNEASLRVWQLDQQALVQRVHESHTEVDILIVSIHAGVMLSELPHPDHQALAHELADAGADLILLHNAHVLQGVERLENGAIICYNLGNAVIDCTEGHVAFEKRVAEQNEGGLFYFEFSKKGIHHLSVLPTVIVENAYMAWPEEATAKRIIERIERLSIAVKSDFTQQFWSQRAEQNTGHLFQLAGHHLKQGNWSAIGYMIRHFRPHHLKLIGVWLRNRLG